MALRASHAGRQVSMPALVPCGGSTSVFTILAEVRQPIYAATRQQPVASTGFSRLEGLVDHWSNE